MKTAITIIFLIFTKTLFGQQIQYVKADNGLIIREKPDKNTLRIGKLDYGSRVRIIQETDVELTVVDNQKSVSGNWVEIQELDENKRGYVFNGYLTPERLSKRIKIEFQDISIQIDLDVWDEPGDLKKVHKDTAKVYVDLGDTPEGKRIKILHSNYKSIEIFQRHENSLTIMNEGPHCDLTEWKHYYSEWKKLNLTVGDNMFVTDSYDNIDGEKFIDVEISELKSVVEQECGGYWPEHIKNIKNVHEYPCGVSISRIFLKILLTKENDSVVEKTISFEIPMGC